MNNLKSESPDVIVPVTLDLSWPSVESTVSDIKFLKSQYGFSRFLLACPGAGWRSEHYPPSETFDRLANMFLKVKEAVSEFGAECGWWITTTLKSGPSDEFVRITNYDNTLHPFSSCPLDPNFRKRFSTDVARFAKIAKPAFIMTEDDYSINAAAKKYGCFCKYHIKEFSNRTGKNYSAEELASIFESETPEGFKLLRKWQELMRDSLVGLSECIRTELDKESPEIPMGYMQAGSCDLDGDCTEAVSNAMAGPHHTPFSRIYGVFYCGGDTKNIPKAMSHALYSRQHIKGNFRFYHESDTYPHTRFFISGKQLKVFMSIAYSTGFCGSTYQAQQLLDDPNEETVFGKIYAAEKKRFGELCKTVQGCTLQGVEVCYDPFYNANSSAVKSGREPLWVKPLSMFGIPYVTTDSDVAFWDVRQAKYCDRNTVLAYLSKGLFLDSEAAKVLCERGFGKYIGVSVGEEVTKDSTLIYDLGAREIICNGFAQESKGRTIHSAHMFAPSGNGKSLKLEITDENCEVITELVNFKRQPITPGMTRFENCLGGRVVVLGETLDGNGSQSLFDYRRRRIIQELIKWCKDDYVFVCEEPGIYIIHNKADSEGISGFSDMVTLINLCEDTVSSLKIHMPPKLCSPDGIKILNIHGKWENLDFEKTDDGLILNTQFEYCEPVYIKF